MDKFERRVTPYAVIAEERAEGDKSVKVLRGYAAVFDKLSVNLGGFREKIDSKAFDDVLDNDVRAVFNHNENYVLGRTKSKTLRLSLDSEGLAYEVDLPNTSFANDLYESIGRGDVQESSFKFTVLEDDWQENDEGIIRTIKKVGRLYDVSPVTFPAYPDTSIAARSLEIRQQNNEFITSARIQLMKAELL